MNMVYNPDSLCAQSLVSSVTTSKGPPKNLNLEAETPHARKMRLHKLLALFVDLGSIKLQEAIVTRRLGLRTSTTTRTENDRVFSLDDKEIAGK